MNQRSLWKSSDFAIAVAFSLVSSAFGYAALTSSQPETLLEPSQAVVELTEVRTNRHYEAVVELNNRGRSVIELMKLLPSCSCTKATVSRTTIPPGSSSRLSIVLQAPDKPGIAQSDVQIMYRKPRRAEILRCQVKVRAKVTSN